MVRFLQEIGCSKLQGFYFSKPIPFDEQKERFSTENRLEYENMEESAYYESIGRVNLCDLDMIALEESSAFHRLNLCLDAAITGFQCGNGIARHLWKRYEQFRWCRIGQQGARLTSVLLTDNLDNTANRETVDVAAGDSQIDRQVETPAGGELRFQRSACRFRAHSAAEEPIVPAAPERPGDIQFKFYGCQEKNLHKCAFNAPN